MNESEPIPQTDQIIEFLIDFMRYRRHVMASLPEEILQMKERFEKMRLGDGARRSTDHDLFFRIGAILSRQENPLPMGELSKALAVPLSTATRIVNGLVDTGVAERVADPEDRRIVRVALTADGRQLYKFMNKYMRERIDDILRHLTADERDQLIYLLRKAADALVVGA